MKRLTVVPPDPARGSRQKAPSKAPLPPGFGAGHPLDGRGRSRWSRRDLGRLAGLPDPGALRASMALRWSGFLRAEFASIDAVAVFFGVTFQCACNWWAGSHAPMGHAVALASVAFPEALARHMGDPAGPV